MSYGTVLAHEDLKSLDNGFITVFDPMDVIGSWEPLVDSNANPYFTHLIRFIKVTNTTNEDVYITLDRTKIGDIVPASTFMLLDISANRMEKGNQLYINYHDIIYTSWVENAGNTGAVYCSAYYGVGDTLDTGAQ